MAYNILHNEYLVVWWNEQGGGVQRDIYARRIGTDGTVESWFATAVQTGKWNWDPDLAYSPVQDNYLVVYTYQVNSTNYDVRARVVSWNGSLIGTEIPVNTDSAVQWGPAVVYNSQDDEYLVVYYSETGSPRITAQRMNASDGSPVSSKDIVGGSGQVFNSLDVAYNSARNEYLIAYAYAPNPTATNDVYAKVASANLRTVGSEIQIVYNAYDQVDVAVTAGPDEYLVVWQDGPSSTHRTIYSRRANGAGTLPGNFIGLADWSGDMLGKPAVAYGKYHGYLVIWHLLSGSGDDDLYVRFVRSGQDAAGEITFNVDSHFYSQRYPAVACATSGDCLGVWESNSTATAAGDPEISGRLVAPYGTYLPLVLKS